MHQTIGKTMNEISRDKILVVKASGSYGSPNFIPPQVADKIATWAGKKLNLDSANALAEIAENFAAEVLACCPSDEPTAQQLASVVRTARLV